MESIKLLQDAGINFEELSDHGIDPMVFGDYLMTSGLIINHEIYWITFHGSYDFSYLYKVLKNDNLPNSLAKYQKFLKHLFPNIYDIKTMIDDMEKINNYSLNKLAEELSVDRHGASHQAGSDSLLTLQCFFALWNREFKDGIPVKYYNKIYGLNNEMEHGNVDF